MQPDDSGTLQGEDALVVNIHGGGRVCVPASLDCIATYVLLEQEDWFEDEIRFVRECVERGMHALDIGAGFGLYTLALAQAVGPEGKVWAFEPAQGTAGYLQRTLSLNGCEWASVIQGAVSNGGVRVDEFAEKSGCGAIDFIKVDLEGRERAVIEGGRSVLATHSPILMIGVGESGVIDLSALDPLEALGYEFYRLLPGPLILAPFDRQKPVEGARLYLFACKRERASRLAERGLLARSMKSAPHRTPQAWTEYARRAPYSREVAARWPEKAGLFASAAEKATMAGLSAFAASRQRDRSPDERWVLLALALQRLAEAASDAHRVLPKISYARVAWEIGERQDALNALAAVYDRLEAHPGRALAEPFLAPSPRYDDVPMAGDPREWLRAAVTEQIEKLERQSSKFNPEASLKLLRPIIDAPFHSAEAGRRWQLARLASGLQEEPHPTALLSARSEDNLNPEFWTGKKRLGGSKEADTIASLWSGMAPVKIVDVGAMSLGEGADPYERLMRAFDCEVIGFEPLEKECAELNRNAQPGRRYLRYFIGDGSERTFYETNTGMTSSLYEPDSALLGKFQHLEELTRTVATHRVQTRRLDDIAEARGTDYLKTDVQGAELMVFRGAAEMLRDVLVVHTEVEFLPMYKEQALFPDIDSFLRAHGFVFHKFEGLSGRTFKPLVYPGNPYEPISQLLWSDAVYVRDFMAFHELAPAQLLKLAAILHENYGSYDLAALALQAHEAKTGAGYCARYLDLLHRRGLARTPRATQPMTAGKGDELRLMMDAGVTLPGWKSFSANPGPNVDYVGNFSNLSQFGDESVDEIYICHRLQHLGYVAQLPLALAEFQRVLKKGGNAKISVPDLDALCRLFLDPKLGPEDRTMVMRMMFGGQVNPDDFNRVGLSQEILIPMFKNAGFSRLERVQHFGLVEDASIIAVAGIPISLNLIAYK